MYHSSTLSHSVSGVWSFTFLTKGWSVQCTLVILAKIPLHSLTTLNVTGSMPVLLSANPAEWMFKLLVRRLAPHTDIDWFQTWSNSPEIAKLHTWAWTRIAANCAAPLMTIPLWTSLLLLVTYQIILVTQRVFQQYWRTPSYIWSKIGQCISSPIFVGFTYWKADNTLQGMQNQMFSVFVFLVIFAPLVEQILPNFVTQRALYEVRERPSKTYSWVAFMLSNIIAELSVANTGLRYCVFLLLLPCWLLPQCWGRCPRTWRGDSLWLFGDFFFLLSTFSHMVVAGIENEHTAGTMATILFTICLIFSGVLATPEQLPGFWIFMYRISPLTYIVSGLMAAGTADSPVVCSAVEVLQMFPPPNMTCSEYLEPFARVAGGYVTNLTSSPSLCGYCAMRNTDTYLTTIHSFLKDTWRNFGFIWIYIIFNIVAACCLYWLIRVPKSWNKKKKL